MNGNNSNNGSNMVSPEDLALGSTGTSSPSSSGEMEVNPFSQSPQVSPTVNSSSVQQQQNPFQTVNQVASTVNVSQQVASTPMNVAPQVVNQPVNQPVNVPSPVVNQPFNQPINFSQQVANSPINNVSQQMMNKSVNNNFQVSGSQQFINEQQNLFVHPHPTNEKNKNITKALFIAMTIIFLIFGIATVYIINIPSELECSSTSDESPVPYTITFNYFFKNETLKNENVTMSIDLGSNYDSEKEYYIEEGKKSLQFFIDSGFKVDVVEKKPVIQIKLHGDGETLMKAHSVNVFSDLSYKAMKLTAENNDYVCK